MLASLEMSLLSALKSRMYSSTAHKSRLNFRSKSLRTVEPVSVKSQDKRFNSRRNEKHKFNQGLMKETERDLRKEIEEYGDLGDEPDPEEFSKSFKDHFMDEERRKEKSLQNKMLRKHFKHLEPKEVSLLTWAEKENIRYLAETEPDQWTPEALSHAYPISPEGVEKLLKFSKKFSTLRDIINHDRGVLKNIEKIKAGEIPITEEIAKRLEVRDLIPINIGDLGVHGKNIFVRPEPDPKGEFAQLVAPPPSQTKLINSTNEGAAVINQLSDGDMQIYDENNQSPMKNSTMTKRELMKIIRRNKLMTFSEFEEKMSKKPQALSEDMKYMLSLNETTTNSNTPTKMESLKVSEVAEGVSFSDTNFPSKEHRLKIPSETGEVVLNLEGEEAYLYHPETGTQRPYSSSSEKIPAKIVIPDEKYRPGATYKVNDCYYDDQGEFMYRVV